MSTNSLTTKIVQSSILESQIRQLQAIKFDANAMFEGIPTINTTGKKQEREQSLQNFKNYVTKIWINHHEVLAILDNIAITAADAPEQSFNEFTKFLPTLSFTGTNSWTSNLQPDLVDYFNKQLLNLSDPNHRFMFNVYFNQILCIFLNKMLF